MKSCTVRLCCVLSFEPAVSLWFGDLFIILLWIFFIYFFNMCFKTVVVCPEVTVLSWWDFKIEELFFIYFMLMSLWCKHFFFFFQFFCIASQMVPETNIGVAGHVDGEIVSSVSLLLRTWIHWEFVCLFLSYAFFPFLSPPFVSVLFRFHVNNLPHSCDSWICIFLKIFMCLFTYLVHGCLCLGYFGFYSCLKKLCEETPSQSL